MADEKHISFGNLAKFKEKYDEKLSDELTSRVDVVEGKGLSTNDFTNELKATLESALQVNDLVDYAKKTDISSVFKYKGSVENYSDLPLENTIGDTYDIVNTNAEHNIDAGDNLTWNGEGWDNLSGIINLTPINTKLSEMETSVSNIGKVEFTSDEDIESLFYTKKSMTNSQNLADFFGLKTGCVKNAYNGDSECYRLSLKDTNNKVVNEIYRNKAILWNQQYVNEKAFDFKINDITINVLFGDVVNRDAIFTDGYNNLYTIDANGNHIYQYSAQPETILKQPSNNLSVLAQRINDTNSCFKADYTNGVFSIINTDGDDFVISNTAGSKIDVASKLNFA